MHIITGTARTVIRTLALAALVCIPAPIQAQEPADTGWIDLFNGHNLDGWVVKITGLEPGQDPARTFRVEDGMLKVVYDGYDRFTGNFGHIFYETPFSSYRLHVEYRFVGEQVPGGPDWALRNSGAMVHSQDPASMTRDQEFPVSIEFQFLGGTGGGPRPTGNLCTPGTNVVMEGQLITRHCTNSTSPTLEGDQWVTAEIEVHGNSTIRHFINGELVLEYEQPQLDPNDPDAQRLIHDGRLALDSGWISLQSESHPIEFRSVRIRILDR